MRTPRLTVIGTGYLGVTHAVCMAVLGFEVVGVILGTSVLVLMFDLAIIYKLYLSTKGFERERAKLLVQVEQAEAKAEAEAAAEAGASGPDGTAGTGPATQPPNALSPVSR